MSPIGDIDPRGHDRREALVPTTKSSLLALASTRASSLSLLARASLASLASL